MTLPARIVIIDDERSVRSGLSNLLQSEGYDTDVFESAEAFLNDEAALSLASLLIIDIKLKGMSGPALYQHLLDSMTPPPVIFVSGHEDENLSRYAPQTESVTLLRKPINIDTLLEQIRRELSLREER
ncbi:response regulator [Yokenella regensburgei]|uniref:response regulator n=1 Tax=Yokenella regensburgei TaxID=158877 RepID=UPI003F1630A7